MLQDDDPGVNQVICRKGSLGRRKISIKKGHDETIFVPVFKEKSRCDNESKPIEAVLPSLPPGDESHEGRPRHKGMAAAGRSDR